MACERDSADLGDLELAARFGLPVLITHKSREIREAYARFIHDRSGRPNAPFIAISCKADAGAEGRVCDLLRATLQQLPEATVFLDDIGESAPQLQSLLVAVLDGASAEKPDSGCRAAAGRVRVLAGSGDSVRARVAAGRFDQTLFCRLNVIHIGDSPG